MRANAQLTRRSLRDTFEFKFQVTSTPAMAGAEGWQDNRSSVLKVSHWEYQLSSSINKLADGLSDSSVCSRVSFLPEGKGERSRAVEAAAVMSIAAHTP
jgi:hypothetical protein